MPYLNFADMDPQDFFINRHVFSSYLEKIFSVSSFYRRLTPSLLLPYPYQLGP
jgi:hypothetical protein